MLRSTSSALIGFLVVATLYSLLLSDPTSIYYVRQTDIQENYFYEGLFLKDYGRINNFLHPGLVQKQLIAIITAQFSNPISSAMAIFNIAYFVTGVVCWFAIGYFLSFEQNIIPFYLRVLSLSPVLLWSPFSYYAITFGADSWVIPLGLTFCSLIWRELGAPHGLSRLGYLKLGLITLLCLGTKLTFAPLIIAGFLSIIVKDILLGVNASVVIRNYVLVLLGVVAILKVIYGYNIITHLYSILIAPEPYLMGSFSNIQSLPGSFVFFYVFSVFFSAARFGYIFYQNSFTKLKLIELFKALFIFFTCILSYKLVITSSGSSPVALRQASGIIIIFPFIFLLIFSSFKSRFKMTRCGIRNFISVAMIFALVSKSAFEVIDVNRAHYVRYQSIHKIVNDAHVQGSTIIINEGTFESAFHNWGDEAYGGNRYLDVIGAAFPRFGSLRIRQYDTGGLRDNVLTLPKAHNDSHPLLVISYTNVNCDISCLKNNLRNSGLLVLGESYDIRSRLFVFDVKPIYVFFQDSR